MDKQLAEAVLLRWSSGLPVSEHNLYKAAEFFGEDPQLALDEARYWTKLDDYLSRGGPMTQYEKDYFKLATGAIEFYEDLAGFTKIANKYEIPEEEIILRTLAQNEFVPYLYKLANDVGPQQGAQVQQDPAARGEAISQATGNPAALMSQDFQGNTLYRPTPTAPGQVPPGQNGNMDQLLYQESNKDMIEGQKNEAVKQQMMQQTQQQPQGGSKEQIQQLYNQMTPEEKAQHATPEAAPEELPEIAQYINQVEQQVGTKITDPAQIKKIYGEMQKAKKKEIDEAIKMQFQNQADASSAGQFGPVPDRLGGGGGAPGGAPPGGDPGMGGPPPGGPQGGPGAAPPGGGAGGPAKPPGGAGGPPKGPPGGIPKMAGNLQAIRRRTLEKLAFQRG